MNSVANNEIVSTQPCQLNVVKNAQYAEVNIKTTVFVRRNWFSCLKVHNVSHMNISISG